MKIQTKQWIQIIASICLLFIGDIGDNILKQRPVRTCRNIHALLDNMIHLLIGCLSWIVVDPYSIITLSNQLIWVTFGSSLIDIDHFIAARSIRIHDAFHAPNRGPFHCSGLLLLFTLIFIPFNLDWALMLLVIFIPHHLRDSIRRGIYLYPPFVHTRPIPNYIVRIILVVFPWFIRYLRIKFGLNDNNRKDKHVLFSSLNV